MNYMVATLAYFRYFMRAKVVFFDRWLLKKGPTGTFQKFPP